MSLPKVFGVGLSKTGTTSVAAAMELLNYRTKHYPIEMLSWEGPYPVQKILGRMNTFAYRNGREPVVSRVPLYRLWKNHVNYGYLNSFDAVFDLPINVYFRELDALFPDARFIYTTRDVGSWLDSARKHFAPPRAPQHDHARNRLRIDSYGQLLFDEARFRAAYEQHDEQVRSYFHRRPEKLLTLDISSGHGWAELCSFLGEEEPEAPFPHLNQARDAKP